MTKPRYTPWGQIQSENECMPGVWSLSTPGHGGLWLTEDRQHQLELLFQFEPFAGVPWYEEDQDWAAVTIAFHQEDTDESVFFAVETALFGGDRWDDVRRYLHGTKHGRAALERAAKFRAEKEKLWRAGSRCTTNQLGMWSVSLRRGSESKWVTMPYPEKQWFTDAELEAITNGYATT